MVIDREAAESAVRGHLLQIGRFDGVDVTFNTDEVAEGWRVVVQPANSYLRRHRRELTLHLFVDRTDGQVHHIPSFGLNLFLARLRRQL
jgi:hypothetical protein